MAVLDSDRNVVVLRLVFDGPAGAGKTETIRALGERLHRPTFTPEELGGRTMYFDWLDYTGGLFEGHKLLCQIVTVPGQSALRHRRDHLVSTADAIIYVTPIRPDNLDEVVSALRQLQTHARGAAVPTGIVVQANKRDLPDGLPIDAIRGALRDAKVEVPVVETVATTGTGVRTSFVLGVRVALDRVRELIRQERLPTGKPDVDNADDLFQQLDARTRARDRTPASPSVSTPAADLLANILTSEAEAPQAPPQVDGEPRLPRLPDPYDLPTGMIWPPIEGRALLVEAFATVGPVQTAASGDWTARGDSGWEFWSSPSWRYQSQSEGRNQLIARARDHASHREQLSQPRLVVLAPDGSGTFRLWLVRLRVATLRETLLGTFEGTDEAVARALVHAARRVFDFGVRNANPHTQRFSPALDTLAVQDGQTVCVTWLTSEASAEAPDFATEFAPLVQTLQAARPELPNVLAQIGSSSSLLDRGVADRLLGYLA